VLNTHSLPQWLVDPEATPSARQVVESLNVLAQFLVESAAE